MSKTAFYLHECLESAILPLCNMHLCILVHVRTDDVPRSRKTQF